MKVTITTQEILAKFGLPADTELVIDTVQVQDDGWISNVGWDLNAPPESLNPNTKIEVLYRDGDTDTGFADDWRILWNEQFGSVFSIVAYRILKD